MSDKQQQPPSPLDALKFLDGILGSVAGSRSDHEAIKGAVGVIGTALTPAPLDPPKEDEKPSDADKRVGHELQG